MLSLRNRNNRVGGSPSPAAIISTCHGNPSDSSYNKSSLRDRLKGLKGFRGNIAEGLAGFKRNKSSYAPDTLYRVNANDNIPSGTLADADDDGETGQTWPAIRKSLSSMASSLQGNRASTDSSRSVREFPQQSPSHRSGPSSRASQRSVRRAVTMGTCVPLVALNRSASRARHSSFSTLSEASAPRLPGLDESTNFLELLNNTGLFSAYTASSEANNTSEAIKVQGGTLKDGKLFIDRTRSIAGRVPFRLKNPGTLTYKTPDDPVQKGDEGSMAASRLNVLDRSIINAKHPLAEEYNIETQKRDTATPRNSRIGDCSAHPVEWLDRVVETSLATRDPISPKLCVSNAAMQAAHKNKTSIFVKMPEDNDQPEPLRCYPGFKAALEDIHDRFGIYYASFAAYNAVERCILLFKTGTKRPIHKFIDVDTAIFDLELARSAWVRSDGYSTSTYSTETNSNDALTEPLDMVGTSNSSRTSTDDTPLTPTGIEDEEPQEIKA
ncbi:hypothetical protein F5Y19DRAFT_109915 [Xylariaceae sp. FL1651]|nr:hypothetical protein F5Y19DRAFT_109915 [Xylariaceae sp. FL1651]